jgi:hypothetical protein
MGVKEPTLGTQLLSLAEHLELRRPWKPTVVEDVGPVQPSGSPTRDDAARLQHPLCNRESELQSVRQ